MFMSQCVCMLVCVFMCMWTRLFFVYVCVLVLEFAHKQMQNPFREKMKIFAALLFFVNSWRVGEKVKLNA